MTEQYTLHNYIERPDLGEVYDGFLGMWPQFMFHDPVAIELYPYLFEHLAHFQTCWTNDQGQKVAEGICIPLVWDGTLENLPDGWDNSLRRGVENHKAGETPTAVSALVATVHEDFVGKGLSRRIIQGMKERAVVHNITALIAPVRPNLKTKYPLMPIENYVNWKREDGLFFDPWLRTHERIGGKFMKIAPHSMDLRGTVAEWEEWTEMKFPETGDYVIEGGLVPLKIDYTKDEGVYIEPNVWMLHEVASDFSLTV